MNHTKGLWEMRAMNNDRIAIVNRNGCLIICEVFNDPDQSMLEATIADARLITAAPDLLEACMESLRVLDALDASEDGYLNEEGKILRDQLRLAVSKAKEDK